MGNSEDFNSVDYDYKNKNRSRLVIQIMQTVAVMNMQTWIVLQERACWENSRQEPFRGGLPQCSSWGYTISRIFYPMIKYNRHLELGCSCLTWSISDSHLLLCTPYWAHWLFIFRDMLLSGVCVCLWLFVSLSLSISLHPISLPLLPSFLFLSTWVGLVSR